MMSFSLLALLAIILSMTTATTTVFASTSTEEPEPETTTEETPTTPEEPKDSDTTPTEEPKETPTEPEPTEVDVNAKNHEDIDPCLLDPSDDSCPKPDPETQECPEGYNMNEDGNCFPEHDSCPRGTHSHEDDETGRCIRDSTPCDPGYFMNDNHNCVNKQRCDDAQNPGDECTPEHKRDNNHDGKDRDRDKDHNGRGDSHNNDKNIDITVIENENEKNSDELGDIDQTIVAIDYENGAGINCVIDEDENGKCETFDVTKDSGKEPLLVIIPFDN